jgi:AcrR family transcriptional regulator
VFWLHGFSATSLDELAAAMGMNRPSIYRAFGGKEAIYRRALQVFVREMDATFERCVGDAAHPRDGLRSFYTEALATYTAGRQARGCLVMCTAAAAAADHPEIRADLLLIMQRLDDKLSAFLEAARIHGALPAAFDVAGRAMLAQALLHSLSLRARAGDSAEVLARLIDSGVDAIVG